MKKLFLLAIAVIGFTMTTNAQDVKFGFKGGVNFANISDFNGQNADGRTGYHIGAVAQFSLMETFAIQPELLYSAQGIKDIDLDYINIPVLAKLKFAGIASVEAGPQFGFVVNDGIEEAFEGISEDAKAQSFDLGLAVGAGVELGGFFGQVRYNLGLTEVVDGGDGKNSTFQISVGYYIF